MYESPTIHQCYPALEKTVINDAGYLRESPRNFFFGMIVTTFPFTRTKRDQLEIMLNARATGTCKQPSRHPNLLF